MNIYKYCPENAVGCGESVIALGFFDGVHIGHRRLLENAKALAKKLSLEFTVFTFPSENSLFKTESPLYKTEDKLKLLESIGADNVIIADFETVANTSAEDFIKNSLMRDMKCKGAVCGSDFRFGKNRCGDAEMLKSMLSVLGATTEIAEHVTVNGEKVSSTKIRNLLLAGEAAEAWKLLGIPYFVTAESRHGLGLGKSFGFPTVNVEFNEFYPPLKRGVYRTVSQVSGQNYLSITNVGTCPTIGEREAHMETHLINFSGDLYGEKVRTFFLGYLRDEIRFESKKELIMQINVDKNTTITENGELKWQEIGLNLL